MGTVKCSMPNNLNFLLQYNLTPIIFQEEEEEIKLEVNVLKTVGYLLSC